MKTNEEIYIVTDACMWEQNNRNSTFNPHAIEVVNIKTGQIRFILSGSKIAFIEGDITDLATQEAYNKGIPEMSDNGKTEFQGTKSKRTGKKNSTKSVSM